MIKRMQEVRRKRKEKEAWLKAVKEQVSEWKRKTKQTLVVANQVNKEVIAKKSQQFRKNKECDGKRSKNSWSS